MSDYDDYDDYDDDWEDEDDWDSPDDYDGEEDEPSPFDDPDDSEEAEVDPGPEPVKKSNTLAKAGIAVVTLIAAGGGLAYFLSQESAPTPEPTYSQETSTSTSTTESEPMTLDTSTVSDPEPDASTPVGAVAGFIVSFYERHDPDAVISYYDPSAGLKSSVVGEEVAAVEWATDVSYDVTPVSETELDVTVNLSGSGGRSATIEQTFTVTEVSGGYAVESIS